MLTGIEIAMEFKFLMVQTGLCVSAVGSAARRAAAGGVLVRYRAAAAAGGCGGLTGRIPPDAHTMHTALSEEEESVRSFSLLTFRRR